ncbi:hypothetical protein ACOMHN_013024 [Nucella lapillus]
MELIEALDVWKWDSAVFPGPGKQPIVLALVHSAMAAARGPSVGLKNNGSPREWTLLVTKAVPPDRFLITPHLLDVVMACWKRHKARRRAGKVNTDSTGPQP